MMEKRNSGTVKRANEVTDWRHIPCSRIEAQKKRVNADLLGVFKWGGELRRKAKGIIFRGKGI